MSRVARALSAVIAAALAACSLVFPVPDADRAAAVDGGDGGGAQRGASDAAVATLGCSQTGRGPELINAGGRVCVDATPVTCAQYLDFLAAGVPLAPQLAGCEDNTSYAPVGDLDGGSAAVDGVDWCDAWAYCAWAGKTLCGAIPGVALAAPVPSGDGPADAGLAHGLGERQASDRDASALVWACEGGDQALLYPYGNDLDSTQCYQAGLPGTPPPEPAPVGSLGCAGGFPGLVDMIGLYQWMDSCTAGSCLATGEEQCRGAIVLPPAIDRASYPHDFGRVVFRCCGASAPAAITP